MSDLEERKIEVAVGGAYEMPDGRSFWVDRLVAEEIARRAARVVADEITRLQSALLGAQAQGEVFRSALEPFGKLHDEIEAAAALYAGPQSDPNNWAKSCDWEDLQRAKSALSSTPPTAVGRVIEAAREIWPALKAFLISEGLRDRGDEPYDFPGWKRDFDALCIAVKKHFEALAGLDGGRKG